MYFRYSVVNFKMYSMCKSSWVYENEQQIRKKNEGTGNMKVVWLDEVFGVGYNHLPPEALAAFNSYRIESGLLRRDADDGGNTWIAEHPALIHWTYNVEKALETGDLTAGYWTSDLMLEAVAEYLDLFDWLYGEMGCGVTGGHQPIINIDWSSNHDAKADDVLAVRNFRSSWGKYR